MKTKNILKQTLMLAIAGLLLSTATGHATAYHVTIDTSALSLPANSVNGPFSLDFQLNSGSTLNNNSAVISNFTFGGGGAPFGLVNLFGGASGSLASSVTLTDTAAFNEFFQSFSTGGIIGFDLLLSQNVDAGPTPDAFSVAILDNNLFNIPTNSADLADTLLHADINTSNALSIEQLHISSGTGSYAGVTVSAPDTGSTIVLFGLSMLGLTVFGRKNPILKLA